MLPSRPQVVAEPAAPSSAAGVYASTERDGVFRLLPDGGAMAMSAAMELGAEDRLFSLDDGHALLLASRSGRTTTSSPTVELTSGPSFVTDKAVMRVTSLADIPGLGVVAGATARVAGLGESAILLRYDPTTPADAWYPYAILDGHREIKALAPHGAGILFGSDVGLGFYGAAEGACAVDAPIAQVSRIVALPGGSFFVANRESSAYVEVWVSPR